MRKVIIICFLFVLVACGNEYTSKQRIVSVGNIQPSGTCRIELAHVTHATDPILQDNIRMYSADKETCDEALQNIGGMYTVTYNMTTIITMRKEGR